MTRKQNAIMDRKYKKVLVKESSTYLDRLDKAVDVTAKLTRLHPYERRQACILARGE